MVRKHRAAVLSRRSLLGGVCLVAAPRAGLTAPAHPVATTVAGRIQGRDRAGVKVFLGVPYGADTGGANRWLPPRPGSSWTGVRQAVAYGPAPPQVTPIGAPMQEETDMLQQAPVGEDCLTLNVYTPAVGPNSGRRAVMVWFHGGGFSAGSGNADSYDGVNLARKQDVVVVSVTHRLNHFGFLYLADLFGEAYADSGNVGMLDCVAALQWVRTNIAQFGGDPGRVMAFGQSGGGAKASTLMGMPPAKGLFHRAVAQSGVARALTRQNAAANAKRLVDALGVTSLRDLQATPWRRIVDVARATPGSGGSAPVVDGRSLPAQVFDPAASALSRDIPLISLTTETENASWGAPVDPLDEAQLLAFAAQETRLGAADAAALISAFRQAYTGKDNTYIAQLLSTQWGRSDGIYRQAVRKAEQAAGGGAPNYFLYFAHHTDVRGGKLHAPHTVEIPYCFDSLAASSPIVGAVTLAKQRTADLMSTYWANFAKTGDPNGGGLPRWDTFTTEARRMMVVTNQSAVMGGDMLAPTRPAIQQARPKARPAGAA